MTYTKQTVFSWEYACKGWKKRKFHSRSPTPSYSIEEDNLSIWYCAWCVL